MNVRVDTIVDNRCTLNSPRTLRMSVASAFTLASDKYTPRPTSCEVQESILSPSNAPSPCLCLSLSPSVSLPLPLSLSLSLPLCLSGGTDLVQRVDE